MRNLCGWLVMFGDGFGWYGSCGIRDWGGFSNVLGISPWLFEIYLLWLVGVVCMGLGSLVCRLDSKTIFLLCLVCFSQVWSVFCSMFWSYHVSRFIPLGRVMCFFFVYVMCNSFSESLGFRCGISIVACAIHYLSNSVMCSWKFLLVLLRCIPPVFFNRNSVRIIGDLIQLVCFIRGISSARPYLANMWCMSLL